MRFIHTADWHLGNQMHDIDRHTEAQTFFRWLKEQIIEKQADTLIVAGDVFDTANPSVEARRLYYTFLASLVDSCCKNVIIVGGNHDSAIMLDSAKELLEVLNIRVVGSINNLAPEDMCFELRGADDTINGICMAVPFMREVELRNVLSSRSSDTDCTLNEVKTTDGDLYSLAYKKVYTDIFSAAKRLRSKRNIPIIATGHLYAAELEGRLNGVASNVKTDDGVKVLDVLGTLGNVPPAVFPPADYVALGHIHYTTMVAKNPAVRYSGSPFVMGFDEAALAHYVLCVDIAESGGTVLVEKLETPQPFVYRRLSGTLAEIKAELQRLLVLGGAVKPIYLELCYQREFGVNAQDFLDDTIRALPEHITVVSWKITEQEKVFSAANGFEQFEAAEIKNLDDKEIFTQLILTKSGLDGASEEGKRAVETFLPLLMQIAGEV
ncbi:MAG: exonuclease subunit SbcD [Treponema sp.]|nr:exonuclease subunit SbcD [Treponema sp.]